MAERAGAKPRLRAGSREADRPAKSVAKSATKSAVASGAESTTTPGRFSHALPRVTPDGAVPAAAFRGGMRALAGAVTILTTIHDGQRLGMTATAVCSVSAEPPRLLACVNQRGTSYAAMADSRLLAVNVLTHEQFPLAERFAATDRSGADRFHGGEWRKGRLGDLPVLSGALCVFECRIAEMIDAVSHGILICDIFEVETNPDARPLLYCDGRFTTLAEQMFDPRYAHQF